jgi:type VI secretion system protein ImpK
MDPAKLDDSYLLGKFREFYSELLELKHMVVSGAWVYPEEEPTEEEGAARGREANVVFQKLLTLFESQALEAGIRGGEVGATFYKDAQYIMAALADETFLNIEWEGKAQWKSNLLESRLFGTHVAGELFYRKLEKLLSERDPVFAEIGALYLLALSLGFRGKYRGVDDGGKLDYYRDQLFSFIFRTKPDLGSYTRRLFPDTYSHTLDEGEVRLLPHAKRWIAVLAAIVLAFLLLSHLTWIHLTSDLNEVIQQILSGGY